MNQIELINSQSGTVHLSDTMSRLSKRSFANLFKNLTENNQQLSFLINLNDETQFGYYFDDFKPFYRGLKYMSIDYRTVKKAFKETLKESGLGSWKCAPINADLFVV